MAESNARERLVDLLDREAFQPVLERSPDTYDDSERRDLQEVQEATRRAQKRYHDQYGSASKVRDMYKDDLESEPAQDVDRKLRRLHLPTLREIEPKFDQLARELGVEESG